MIFGYAETLRQIDPEIDQRIASEGKAARKAGVPLDANPYTRDGEYGWWRTGWLSEIEEHA